MARVENGVCVNDTHSYFFQQRLWLITYFRKTRTHQKKSKSTWGSTRRNAMHPTAPINSLQQKLCIESPARRACSRRTDGWASRKAHSSPHRACDSTSFRHNTTFAVDWINTHHRETQCKRRRFLFNMSQNPLLSAKFLYCPLQNTRIGIVGVACSAFFVLIFAKDCIRVAACTARGPALPVFAVCASERFGCGCVRLLPPLFGNAT